MNVTVSPGLATEKAVIWKTGSSKTASVNAAGTVNAKAEGTTTVSATAKDGSGKSDSVYLSVYKKVTETSGYLKSDTDFYAVGNDKVSIGKGKRGTKLTVVGVCGTYYRVRTVGNLVSATHGGLSYVPKTKVAIPVVNVMLDKKRVTVLVGEKLQLMATVNPSMADNKQVTWKSGNKKIASVNSKGEVTAKKAGRAVITVTSVDGKKSESCEVSVVQTKYERNRAAKSKPTLYIETKGMDKVKVTVSDLEVYNGFTLYVNGKKYKDYTCKKRRGSIAKSLTKLKVNKTYKIKARTFMKKGKKKIYSKMSSEQKWTAGKIDISANVVRDKAITVSWGKVKDAKEFQIYRAGKRYGTYKRIKTVKAKKESYTDKKVKLNKIYYYKVKPVYRKKKRGTSNIDYAVACKLKSAVKYLSKKYPFVCTDGKKSINSYNVNGRYPFVKYRFVKDKLEIHVYLDFVTYQDTGQLDARGLRIYEKKKAAVQSEVPTDKYISMFKAGIKNVYEIKIFGGKGDFTAGANFDTKMIIHEKKQGKKYNIKQKFIEVLIGGECPGCSKPGDHWYHTGANGDESKYFEKGIPNIYMPTHEQVRSNASEWEREPDVEPEMYGKTAAHELGHALGLGDAYYDGEHDRCADNSETGYEYKKGKYDNLMKSYIKIDKINANGIEMLLEAAKKYKGMPLCGREVFQSFEDNIISPAIINHKDNQDDSVISEE